MVCARSETVTAEARHKTIDDFKRMRGGMTSLPIVTETTQLVPMTPHYSIHLQADVSGTSTDVADKRDGVSDLLVLRRALEPLFIRPEP